MNATLSTRQLRVVVILGMFVLVVGGYLVVARAHSNNSTAPATSTPATSTPAQTTSTPSTTHTHTAAPTARTHGLPNSVLRALDSRSVVVVSLTTPRGADEQIASAEAKAGAAEAKAGYVAIDVFHQRPGTTILRKIGVVDTPATLVIKRSGAIVSDFPGFVDRDVIAQAVADAR